MEERAPTYRGQKDRQARNPLAQHVYEGVESSTVAPYVTRPPIRERGTVYHSTEADKARSIRRI